MDKRSLARSRGGSNASFSSMESSSSTNSLAKGNPFLTKESIMYLKMNPMDQTTFRNLVVLVIQRRRRPKIFMMDSKVPLKAKLSMTMKTTTRETATARLAHNKLATFIRLAVPIQTSAPIQRLILPLLPQQQDRPQKLPLLTTKSKNPPPWILERENVSIWHSR